MNRMVRGESVRTQPAQILLRYMGVSYHRKTMRWQSRISVNGKQKHLGYFITATMAARRYDQEALKVYGEFAYINL